MLQKKVKMDVIDGIDFSELSTISKVRSPILYIGLLGLNDAIRIVIFLEW